MKKDLNLIRKKSMPISISNDGIHNSLLSLIKKYNYPIEEYRPDSSPKYYTGIISLGFHNNGDLWLTVPILVDILQNKNSPKWNDCFSTLLLMTSITDNSLGSISGIYRDRIPRGGYELFTDENGNVSFKNLETLFEYDTILKKSKSRTIANYDNSIISHYIIGLNKGKFIFDKSYIEIYSDNFWRT